MREDRKWTVTWWLMKSEMTALHMQMPILHRAVLHDTSCLARGEAHCGQGVVFWEAHHTACPSYPQPLSNHRYLHIQGNLCLTVKAFLSTVTYHV